MAHGTETFKHGGEIYHNKNIQYDFSININPFIFMNICYFFICSSHSL